MAFAAFGGPPAKQEITKLIAASLVSLETRTDPNPLLQDIEADDRIL